MASVQLRSARTEARDPEAAAEALIKQLDFPSREQPKLVTLMAARSYDHAALNRALRARLPKDTRLIGASSAGEIDNEGIHDGSALVSALSGDFEVGLGLGGGLSTDALSAGNKAVAQACAQLGVRNADLDSRKFVGLVIDDGFRYKKEELLLGMLEKNQALTLVGGGAADAEPDPAKQSALIHVDGEVVTDAALIALFRTDAPWGALRSHWYEPTGDTLRITKIDPTAKFALEIDGRPAAKRYSELLGVSVDELEFGLPRGFSQKPAALRVGREYFLRAPWKPMPDGAILFANVLEEDMELEIMRMGDPVALTRRFFEQEVPRRVQSPKAALFFNCSGRMWTAHGGGFAGGLSETFRAAPPCAGFNAYFEIYCGLHINTTLTSLIFGSNA
jgi:hypothetical protein